MIFISMLIFISCTKLIQYVVYIISSCTINCYLIYTIVTNMRKSNVRARYVANIKSTCYFLCSLIRKIILNYIIICIYRCTELNNIRNNRRITVTKQVRNSYTIKDVIQAKWLSTVWHIRSS